MSITGSSSITSIEDLPSIPLVLEKVTSRFLRDNRIIPIAYQDNRIRIVTTDPPDPFSLQALRLAVGSDVSVVTADAALIDDYFSRLYGQENRDIGRLIEEIDDRGELELIGDDDGDVGHLKDLASEAPIIKLANTLIVRAVESRASDIHIEPYEDTLRVRYRIDGMLHDIEYLPKRLQPALISRIKLMAKLNIAERRLPQDGRIKLKVAERELDLRISTVPVMHGEGIVMRILHRESVTIDLQTMGFSEDTLAAFVSLLKKPNGIILVTGPTGSGKTTTLYGALDKINSPDRKIITVEDPVEYLMRGINQIQVKPQIDLNFANVLRHIVRQDPDVIMIGEIRDLETAEIAIQAALTGHLVFSTLHTNDAPSAITRLLDMGVEHFLLSSTLRGILAQRLVRVICPHCKTVDASPAAREELGMLGIRELDAAYIGAACEQCAQTGFYGRSGIFELLTVDEEMQRLIIKQSDASRLREADRRSGMKTLLEDGIAKISAGTTTIGEVLRVTQEA